MATVPQTQHASWNSAYRAGGRSGQVDPHRASMLASLEHRLEVARSRQDAQLIALLEKERREILAEAPLQGLKARLQAWWSQLSTAIANRDQLQVNEMQDGEGHCWWRAYDPNSGHEVYTDSETELLLWIEEHYTGR